MQKAELKLCIDWSLCPFWEKCELLTCKNVPSVACTAGRYINLIQFYCILCRPT